VPAVGGACERAGARPPRDGAAALTVDGLTAPWFAAALLRNLKGGAFFVFFAIGPKKVNCVQLEAERANEGPAVKNGPVAKWSQSVCVL